MCIVLLTTAHPSYSLIVIDNRDEFILRPTSRAHWWKTLPKPVAPTPTTLASTHSSASASTVVSAATSTAPSSRFNSAIPTPLSSSPPKEAPTSDPRPPPQNTTAPNDVPATTTTTTNAISVLSARDLQRAERGTWLGITRGGNFAVLTNYRETDAHDTAHPVHAARSRGGMVTAWMAADPKMSLGRFVEEMLQDGGTKGVGGFSLLCGKLRKKRPSSSSSGEEEKEKEKEIEPIAIISNRYDSADEVPWVARNRGETIGLSNTCFGDVERWPKIEDGKTLLEEVVRESTTKSSLPEDEDELVKKLFAILDTDSMPIQKGLGFEDYLYLYKQSIFVPPLGDDRHQHEMEEIRSSAPAAGSTGQEETTEPSQQDEDEEVRVDNLQGFSTGLYGTQTQTVMLVDWDGNVRFIERALWDPWGREIARGKGDVTFRFKVEGWEDGDGDGEDGDIQEKKDKEGMDSKIEVGSK